MRVSCRSMRNQCALMLSVGAEMTPVCMLPSFAFDANETDSIKLDIVAGHAASFCAPHMRATLDACCAKNWSAGQCGSWHAAGPRVSLKVPAAHAAHAPPLGPEKPALHSHMELFELAGGEMVLGGHSMHCSPQLLPRAALHPCTSTSQSVRHPAAGSAKYTCLPYTGCAHVITCTEVPDKAD